jgi:hypothetical protein
MAVRAEVKKNVPISSGSISDAHRANRRGVLGGDSVARKFRMFDSTTFAIRLLVGHASEVLQKQKWVMMFIKQ